MFIKIESRIVEGIEEYQMMESRRMESRRRVGFPKLGIISDQNNIFLNIRRKEQEKRM